MGGRGRAQIRRGALFVASSPANQTLWAATFAPPKTSTKATGFDPLEPSDLPMLSQP